MGDRYERSQIHLLPHHFQVVISVDPGGPIVGYAESAVFKILKRAPIFNLLQQANLLFTARHILQAFCPDLLKSPGVLTLKLP